MKKIFCKFNCSTLSRFTTGLTVRGSNPVGGGRDFLHPSRKALGFNQPPVQGVPVSCLEVNCLGCGVHNSNPSSTEVKKRVEQYL